MAVNLTEEGVLKSLLSTWSTNQNCNVDVVDSTKDEDDNIIYKICCRQYVWSKADSLKDYSNLLRDYWKKSSSRSTDEKQEKDVSPSKSGRKRKAYNPKKVESNNEVSFSETYLDADVILELVGESDEESEEDTDEYDPNEGREFNSKCVTRSRSSSKKLRSKPKRKSLKETIEPITRSIDSLLQNVFECMECHYKCTTSEEFREHWQKNHPGKKQAIKCSFCDRTFTQGNKLLEHSVRHTDVRPYKCSKCDKTYRYSKGLREHYRQIHGEDTLQCKICKENIETRKDLAVHYDVKHDGFKFVCKNCNIRFKEDTFYNDHIKECRQRFNCTQCEKSFAARADCTMHEKMHDGTNPHYCAICDKYFLKNSKLLSHMLTHQKKELKEKVDESPRPEFICPHCDKKFIDKRSFIAHVGAHDGTNPHYCKECDHYFPSKGKLDVHNAWKHSGELLTCPVCDRVFQREQSYNAHIKHHKEVDPNKRFRCKSCPEAFADLSTFKKHLEFSPTCLSYSCDVCQQKFQTIKRLNVHKKNHTDVMEHQCEICLKKFRHKCDLTKHSREHSIDQQFSCTKCEDRFIERWQLNAHMVWHETGKHPFQCEICDKRLSKFSKLQAHIRQVHDKIKEYSCDTCGKEYGAKADLKRHEKIHEMEFEGMGSSLVCMICSADGFTSETLEEHQLVHLRVETKKACVIDFDQLNHLQDIPMLSDEEESNDSQEAREFKIEQNLIDIPALLQSNLTASEKVLVMEAELENSDKSLITIKDDLGNSESLSVASVMGFTTPTNVEEQLGTAIVQAQEVEANIIDTTGAMVIQTTPLNAPMQTMEELKVVFNSSDAVGIISSDAAVPADQNTELMYAQHHSGNLQEISIALNPSVYHNVEQLLMAAQANQSKETGE